MVAEIKPATVVRTIEELVALTRELYRQRLTHLVVWSNNVWTVTVI